MAKLTWDDSGKRLYETGTKQGVLYPMGYSGTYENGVAWNGLTGVTLSPSGAEATKLYADDINYLTMYSVEEMGATVTAYTYPKEFEPCDGSAELTDGVYVGQQDRQAFGLCWRTVLGNDTQGESYGYKLHILYGCKASPSERAYSTVNDSPEAVEMSWELTTTPVNVTGMKPTAYICIDSTKADSSKLTELENKLYGDASSGTPTLPLPDEVKTIMTVD